MIPPTPAQRIRLLELTALMRHVAYPVGSCHSWWDDIHDCESLAEGRSSALGYTPEKQIAECEPMVAAKLSPAEQATIIRDWRAIRMDLRTAGDRAKIKHLLGDVPDWAMQSRVADEPATVGEILDRWVSEHS